MLFYQRRCFSPAGRTATETNGRSAVVPRGDAEERFVLLLLLPQRRVLICARYARSERRKHGAQCRGSEPGYGTA